MKPEYEVVIIGGGPAGLSAAMVFARRGVKTLVCEKQRIPVDKICGEGVMPVGVKYLERLGAARFLSAEEVYPFKGVRYHSKAGAFAVGEFAGEPGWGVRRTHLSAALARQAGELESIDICDGVSAHPIASHNEQVTVAVGRHRVTARLLVGADGARSRVRRWAGLQGPPPAYQRWGASQHFSVTPWSQYVEVYWGGGGLEAYITPCGKHTVGVAFLWDRKRMPKAAGGPNLIPSFIEAFPLLKERLAGAPACSPARATGPLQQNSISPVGRGVILIGDAAGYLDALTGEGISLAAAQALALEETVIPALQAQDAKAPLLDARRLAGYRRAYKDITRPYLRATHLALWFSRQPDLAERAIRSLAAHPSFFTYLLSANMGTVPW